MAWLEHWGRNGAERETVERLSASDASDQASLGSNPASEHSRSWSQLIRSSRLRHAYGVIMVIRGEHPSPLHYAGADQYNHLRRPRLSSKARMACFAMAVMTVTRQEKGRGKDKRIRGKTTKRTRHSRNFSKLWRVVGSNEIGRHCNNYYNPSVVILINHSRHW